MNENKIQTTITQKIPGWKLKLAYFYTDNKIFIKRAGLFLFFFTDLLILFALGTLWINYKTGLIKDNTSLSQLPFNLVNNQVIKKNQPQKIFFEKTQVVAVGHNKYNLITKVTNRNSKWAVPKMSYTLEVDGQELKPQTTFILPNSEKYLIYFNVSNARSAQLKILNTQWQRIKDYSLLSYKDSFKITKSDFKASDSNIYSGISTIGIYNDSPFDYWIVGAPVILYDKLMQPLAVDYITVNKLRSKETRQIELNWHENIESRVYQTKVYPEINLLDKNVIMKLKATIGSPLGRE